MTDDVPPYARPSTHYHVCACGHFWLCKKDCGAAPDADCLRTQLPGVCTLCKPVTIDEVRNGTIPTDVVQLHDG